MTQKVLRVLDHKSHIYPALGRMVHMSSKVGHEEGVAGVGGGEEDGTAIGEFILVAIPDLDFSGERWDNGVTIFIEADGETIFIGADVAMGDFTRLLGGSVAMEVFILVTRYSGNASVTIQYSR